MVSHVAGLYPVKVFHDLPRHAENPCDDTNGENPLLPCLSSRTMFYLLWYMHDFSVHASLRD